MRLYGINKENEFILYNEQDFKMDKTEKLLEEWFEENPFSVFEDERILIIGRQVTTNLNSFIDLLGLDKNGNTVFKTQMHRYIIPICNR